MSIALIADAHLGGPGGSAELLVAQLRELPARGCRELILLGDLFHVWIGDQRYETADVRLVVAALRDLRLAGVSVRYVEGNRDFFLDQSPYRDAFDELARQVVFEHAGRRYLAVHGDGLDERDWRYRFWRWLSKSPPSRALFARLPGPFARRIVSGTERRLARTNFKHKKRIPERVVLAYAERRLAEGYDELLLGHFHQPHTWRAGDGTVRILDAWFRTRTVEWLAP
jgi:UDP-2,3-diacylglucosamine hydrolase